ncbi:MAG: hypothetical protein IID18_10300 [Nitrospinae bacterium]|nr:hypothetical protein [Nitrospinota bacterium]
MNDPNVSTPPTEAGTISHGGITTTQIGAIGEHIAASQLMLASQGRLSPFLPMADDDGIDLLIFGFLVFHENFGFLAACTRTALSKPKILSFFCLSSVFSKSIVACLDSIVEVLSPNCFLENNHTIILIATQPTIRDEMKRMGACCIAAHSAASSSWNFLMSMRGALQRPKLNADFGQPRRTSASPRLSIDRPPVANVLQPM